MLATLPVLMTLSWVPHAATVAPTATPPATQAPAQASETIRCPLTGEQIPSCCCPVRK